MSFRSRDLFGTPMMMREQVGQALQQTGGDVPAATRLLMETGRDVLVQRGQAWVDSYTTRAKAQAEQRAIPERSTFMLAKADELHNEIEPLLDEGEQDHVARARRRLEFARFSGEPDLVRECTTDWAVLEVEQALRPLQATIVQQAADRLSSYATMADEDLQAALRVYSLLHARLDRAENAFDDDRLGVEWGEDRPASESYAARAVAKQLRLPIGDLAARSPADVADDIVAQIKRGVLNPPGIKDSLPAQELAALLGAMPAWAGINRAERPLWGLQTPRAIIRKPAAVTLPAGLPPGYSVTVSEGDGFTFLARMFRILPLPLVAGFDAALEHGQTVRASYGGVLASSAEPWKESEHRAIVERFTNLRDRWTGGNGHVESLSEESLNLEEVVDDAAPRARA